MRQVQTAPKIKTKAGVTRRMWNPLADASRKPEASDVALHTSWIWIRRLISLFET
ncbi:MAG: hypothetical protein WBQ12_17815 [Candidatus Sulfotelmatobacter sp.]